MSLHLVLEKKTVKQVKKWPALLMLSNYGQLCLQSSSNILVLATCVPTDKQRKCVSNFRSPDWQMDNGIFNKTIIVDTQIQVHRCGPRTRISVLCYSKLNQNFSSICGEAGSKKEESATLFCQKADIKDLHFCKHQVMIKSCCYQSTEK